MKKAKVLAPISQTKAATIWKGMEFHMTFHGHTYFTQFPKSESAAINEIDVKQTNKQTNKYQFKLKGTVNHELEKKFIIVI